MILNRPNALQEYFIPSSNHSESKNDRNLNFYTEIVCFWSICPQNEPMPPEDVIARILFVFLRLIRISFWNSVVFLHLAVNFLSFTQKSSLYPFRKNPKVTSGIHQERIAAEICWIFPVRFSFSDIDCFRWAISTDPYVLRTIQWFQKMSTTIICSTATDSSKIFALSFQNPEVSSGIDSDTYFIKIRFFSLQIDPAAPEGSTEYFAYCRRLRN